MARMKSTARKAPLMKRQTFAVVPHAFSSSPSSNGISKFPLEDLLAELVAEILGHLDDLSASLVRFTSKKFLAHSSLNTPRARLSTQNILNLCSKAGNVGLFEFVFREFPFPDFPLDHEAILLASIDGDSLPFLSYYLSKYALEIDVYTVSKLFYRMGELNRRHFYDFLSKVFTFETHEHSTTRNPAAHDYLSGFLCASEEIYSEDKFQLLLSELHPTEKPLNLCRAATQSQRVDRIMFMEKLFATQFEDSWVQTDNVWLAPLLIRGSLEFVEFVYSRLKLCDKPDWILSAICAGDVQLVKFLLEKHPAINLCSPRDDHRYLILNSSVANVVECVKLMVDFPSHESREENLLVLLRLALHADEVPLLEVLAPHTPLESAHKISIVGPRVSRWLTMRNVNHQNNALFQFWARNPTTETFQLCSSLCEFDSKTFFSESDGTSVKPYLFLIDNHLLTEKEIEDMYLDVVVENGDSFSALGRYLCCHRPPNLPVEEERKKGGEDDLEGDEEHY